MAAFGDMRIVIRGKVPMHKVVKTTTSKRSKTSKTSKCTKLVLFFVVGF